ncbi:MAG: HAMP domain-containing protein [Deinococcota bacterium]
MAADNQANYVVELQDYPREQTDAILDALTQQFRIAPDQASTLLQHAPGVATKPMSQANAQLASERFRSAGLNATVKALSSTAEASARQSGERRKKPKEVAKTRVDSQAPRGRRRVSLRTKFLLSVVFPVLLTLLGALSVISFNVAPALREQLLSTARAPALSTVERIESLLPSTELANERLDTPESLPVLQETTEGLRRAFGDQSISFITVTDTIGRHQAGWFNRMQRDQFGAVRDDLNQAIEAQAIQAVALGDQFDDDIPEDQNPSQELRVPNLGQLEIISQPIRRSGQTLGAVVVGVNTSIVIARVREILRNTILVTFLPIVIAFLIALLIGRGLTRNVLALTEAADRLSKGDLDTTVDVRSNDELGDLSDAFERLRVSLRLAMNRLRRKSRPSN